MGKKSAKRTWFEYFLSFHHGFCCGPVDALTGLWFNEKEAWTGAMTSGKLTIEADELFGGSEREGGANGDVHVMLGEESQVSPQSLADRVGLTPETMPAYRNACTMFFTGKGGSGGFMVGANYPSVPSVWARFRRASVGLPAPGGTIANEYGTYDTNAAHLLYELYTNQDWGMRSDPAFIDTDSFVAAAATLYEEKFGLSIKWTQQSTIEAFTQEVLDHIQGMVFLDPRTGKLKLKLIRNDYDPATIPEIGPEDFDVSTFRRKLWGETVNEIIVQWTDPRTEETASITGQNLANIAMQGEVVSQTSDYYGIRSAELASQVLTRDMRSQSLPLATAKGTLDRRKWDITPGQVLRVRLPKYNIENIVMRVMDVDYGRPGDSKITIELLEDAFGIPSAIYMVPPDSEWEDPAQDPDDDVYIVTPPESYFFAFPLPLINQTFGDDNVSDDDYPDIIIAPMVTPLVAQSDMVSYRLLEQGINPTGSVEWVDGGEKSLTGRAYLSGAPLYREAESTFQINMRTFAGRTWPQVGGLGVLNGASTQNINWTYTYPEHYEAISSAFIDDASHEIVMFLEDLGTDDNGIASWRVARGIFDTVPRRWTSGAEIRFIDDNFASVDSSPNTARVGTTYKIQPRTSKGFTSDDLVDPVTTYHVERPYMPFRPANVTVDGTMFSEINGPSAIDYRTNYEPRVWTVECQWSNRNRHLEDSVYRRWTDGDVPGEDGQETDILISHKWYSQGSNVVEGIIGTSYMIDVFQTARSEDLTMFFIGATGYKSIQAVWEWLRFYPKGYGSDWGYFYGGWDDEFGIGRDIEDRFEVPGRIGNLVVSGEINMAPVGDIPPTPF